MTALGQCSCTKSEGSCRPRRLPPVDSCSSEVWIYECAGITTLLQSLQSNGSSAQASRSARVATTRRRRLPRSLLCSLWRTPGRSYPRSPLHSPRWTTPFHGSQNLKPFKCGSTAPRSTHPPTAGAAPSAAASSDSVKPGRVANASAVVASFAPDFRVCYNAALRQAPDAAGAFCITAKIGVAGEVVGTAIELLNDLPPSVGECAAAVVQRARFSPPDGGSATIVIPVSFAPR